MASGEVYSRKKILREEYNEKFGEEINCENCRRPMRVFGYYEADKILCPDCSIMDIPTIDKFINDNI